MDNVKRLQSKGMEKAKIKEFFDILKKGDYLVGWKKSQDEIDFENFVKRLEEYIKSNR